MPQFAAMHTSPLNALAHKAVQMFGFVNRSSSAMRHRSGGTVRFGKVLPVVAAEANFNVSTAPESLFPLGRIALTPSATALLDKHRVDVATLLARYQCGDWGCVDKDDHADNIKALSTSGRILAMFELSDGNAFNSIPADEQVCPASVLISTNGSRLATTVLTPADLWF